MSRAGTSPLSSLLGLVLAGGCATITDEDEKWRLDPDGDGVPLGQDCDDDDPAAARPVTFYLDADGDGFGDPASEQTGCRVPAGAVDDARDCDDGDADIHPDAPDTWYDGVDSDCAGNDDMDQDGDGYGVDVDCDDLDPTEAPDPAVAETWYNGVDDNCDMTDQDGDHDGDGYWAEDYAARVAESGGSPLSIPAGRAGDCWDDPSTTPADQVVVDGATALAAEAVNPGAAETWYDGADQDCRGADADANGVSDDFDQDGDAWADATHPDATGATGRDCDDGDPAVNPGATETWYDGVDADCAGDADDDADGDLYAAVARGGEDCDDHDASVNPGALDFWYDGVDADCGGEDDYDADGDGDPSADWGGFDCDEGDAAVSSAATETWYDGVDQDCSGGSDYDADGDGYDSEAVLAGGGDCDDAAAAASPAETEVCGDGFDNDCDGRGIDPTSGEACWLEGELTADFSAAVGIIYAQQAGEQYGFALAGGRDLTGDGLPDLVVGGRFADADAAGAGRLYVYTGGLTGSAVASVAAPSIAGDEAGAYLGNSVELVDLDGDGHTDLVAGAPASDLGQLDGGAACFIPGPLGASLPLSAAASARLKGSTSPGDLGWYLAVVGDQDGDGIDEIAVGDEQAGAGIEGEVVLWSDPSGDTETADWPRVLGTAPDGGIGEAIAAGDTDGDGIDDLLLGAATEDVAGLADAGAAYVVLGPVTTDTATSSAVRLTGDTAGAELGRGVSIAPDFDGDGYADLVVGAPSLYAAATGETGVTYVVFGPATTSGSLSAVADVTLLPEPDTSGATSAALCGRTVDASGDVDGDGHSDLLLACHGQTAGGHTSTGSVYLFYGGVSGTTVTTADARARISGDQASEGLGRAARILPDLDGDGYDEVVLGAPFHDVSGASSSGRVVWLPGGSW